MSKGRTHLQFSTKKSWMTILACLAACAIVALVGYRLYLSATTLVVWGIRVPKSQLNLARIDTLNGKTSHAYEVHDSRLVLQIAQEVSHMKRLGQVAPTNFPPSEGHTLITQLLFVTTKYGSTGGSFWSVSGGSGIWQDADGYYWSVPGALMSIVEHDIQSKSTMKVF